jgi:hypothetical protein
MHTYIPGGIYSSACLRGGGVIVCVLAMACVCATPRGEPSFGRARNGGIYSSARMGRTETRAPLRMAPVGSRALAAGATWTLMIASAPWGGRNSHTSVVDAAGAIYVIGGFNGGTYYNDVYASTDKGADRQYSSLSA